MEELVSVKNVDVIRAATRILHNVSLQVNRGDSLALLGANGSGKSTLIRTMLGIYPTATGSVELFGVPLGQRVPWDRLGYVPQRVAASSGVPATALEVVRSGLLGPGVKLFADRGPAARARAMEALEMVNLADRAHDHVQVFSGGQAQRVLIARALVRKPELLFLDEPLAGIDHDSREGLASILSQLRNEGITLVTVLHEMGELEDLVNRAVVLEGGHILSDSPISEHYPPTSPGHDHPGHDHVHPHESAERHPHHAPVLSIEIS